MATLATTAVAAAAADDATPPLLELCCLWPTTVRETFGQPTTTTTTSGAADCYCVCLCVVICMRMYTHTHTRLVSCIGIRLSIRSLSVRVALFQSPPLTRSCVSCALCFVSLIFHCIAHKHTHTHTRIFHFHAGPFGSRLAPP